MTTGANVLGKILEFIGFPEPLARFRLDIRNQGSSQDQVTTKEVTEKFKDFLLFQSEKFRLKSEDGDNGSGKDLYFYRDWGGFTYIHLVVYSTRTKIDFVSALIKFAKEKGELSVEEESIVLIMN